MATDAIAYDKAELRGIIKAFGAMSDEAVAEAISGYRHGARTRFRGHAGGALQLPDRPVREFDQSDGQDSGREE